MTREELQQDFHNYLGESWSNSQGKINIYYVMWLENKILRREVAEMPTEEEIELWWEDFQWGLAASEDYFAGLEDGFKGGIKYFRNRMTSSEKPNNHTRGEG